MKLILLLILLVPNLSWGDYTLLSSMTTSPGLKVNCSVSVLIDYTQSEIRVIRLQTAGGKPDLAAFLKEPEKYKNYGSRFPLGELFPGVNLEEVGTIDARFDLHEKKLEKNSSSSRTTEDSSSGKTIKIVATPHKGRRLAARRDLASFLTAGDKCLQPQ